jgi:hypothetical protein
VLLPPDEALLRLASFFLLIAGRDPDAENDASLGAAATLTGVIADGAWLRPLLDAVALPIPNAAPNATSTDATAIAVRRPGLMSRCRRRRA